MLLIFHMKGSGRVNHGPGQAELGPSDEIDLLENTATRQLNFHNPFLPQSLVSSLTNPSEHF